MIMKMCLSHNYQHYLFEILSQIGVLTDFISNVRRSLVVQSR